LLIDLYGVRLTKLFEWILGRHIKIEIMNARHLRQVLDKMMKGNLHVGNARIQVCLPDGKYYDITSLQLLENKLLGARETHRLAFTVKSETWNMGKVLRKID
jgi:hypothetical protein